MNEIQISLGEAFVMKERASDTKYSFRKGRKATLASAIVSHASAPASASFVVQTTAHSDNFLIIITEMYV